MKIRPFFSSNPAIVVSPRALGVLACASFLAAACSSDEPATSAGLPGSGPNVLSADPGAVANPVDPAFPEPESPGAEPFSAPPPVQEPPATETNFLVPPCQKTGPASDTVPVGDAGLGALEAGPLDAGLPAGEQSDAAASSEPFDQSCLADPGAG
jgi:hypothetical protein